jgi:AAA15 family ATPase/GTPase
VQLRHYRGLRDIQIASFSRINLIGGLNGTGKTTLLEALFTICDRLGPIGFLRPVVFRSIETNLGSNHPYLFSDLDASRPIDLVARTRERSVRVRYTWEHQKYPNRITSVAELNAVTDVSSEPMGLTLEVFNDNKQVIKRSFIDVAEGILTSNIKSENEVVPPAVLLSRYSINSSVDLTRRFSKVLEMRRKSAIVELAKLISPEVEDILIIQSGSQSHLYAQITDEKLIPLSFVGDGALTIVGVGLAIMECQNGVVLLDEFDSAIHYSQLGTTWTAIARLSQEYNCQIFAATHSRECILTAYSALSNMGRREDILYWRLDRIGRDVVATRYEDVDLKGAAEEDWEIR